MKLINTLFSWNNEIIELFGQGDWKESNNVQECKNRILHLLSRVKLQKYKSFA